MAKKREAQADRDIQEIECALYNAVGSGTFVRDSAAEALRRLAHAAGSSYGRDGKFMFEIGAKAHG